MGDVVGSSGRQLPGRRRSALSVDQRGAEFSFEMVVLFIADHSRFDAAIGLQFRFVSFNQVKFLAFYGKNFLTPLSIFQYSKNHFRLLYDEYMFYLVEHRVAQATGQTALGILSQLGIDVMQPHHHGSQSDSIFASGIGHLQPSQSQHSHDSGGHFISPQAIEPTTPGSFVDVDPAQFLNAVSQSSYTEIPAAAPHQSAATQSKKVIEFTKG